VKDGLPLSFLAGSVHLGTNQDCCFSTVVLANNHLCGLHCKILVVSQERVAFLFCFACSTCLNKTRNVKLTSPLNVISPNDLV